MGYRQVGNADVASESTHVRYPFIRRPLSKYPVLCIHGAGTAAQYETSWSNSINFASVLARGSAASNHQGIVTGSHYFAGDSLANDVSMARIDAMVAYMGTKTGGSTSKVHLHGTSMGGGISLRYAGLYPNKVASVSGVIPMSNINTLSRTNVGSPLTTASFTSKIATAWGTAANIFTSNITLTAGSTNVTTTGTFTPAMNGFYVVTNTGYIGAYNNPVPINATFTYVSATQGTLSVPATASTTNSSMILAQPLPSGADLPTIAAGAAGVPTRLYYSTVDPLIQVSDVLAIKNAIGASAQAIPVDSNFGHSNSTFGLVGTYNGGTNYSDLISWLVANGA